MTKLRILQAIFNFNLSFMSFNLHNFVFHPAIRAFMVAISSFGAHVAVGERLFIFPSFRHNLLHVFLF